MYEIKKEIEITLIEKKSKFITRLKKIKSEQQAKEILQAFKSKERAASHHCYAYRLRKENHQVYIKRGDDGEPTGTAGAPMLAVLNGEDLINVLAVTTRYFGGIKLGTGGLTSMYKKGVAEAVKTAGKILFEQQHKVLVSAPINKSDLLLALLAREQINSAEKTFTHEIRLTLFIVETKLELLEQIVKRCRGKIKRLDN